MHPFCFVVTRLLLSAVWIVAGVSKLAQREPRDRSVADFAQLPRPVAMVVGTALPWVELSLGLCLLLGIGTALAASASVALLALFTIAIIANLARGRRVECNCFGQLGRTQISWYSVARNLALLTAALLIARTHSTFLTIEGWREGAVVRPADPPFVDLVPVLLMTLAGTIVWSLGASMWQVVRAVAKADDGPALGLAERRYIRRWMGLEPGEAAARNGR